MNTTSEFKKVTTEAYLRAAHLFELEEIYGSLFENTKSEYEDVMKAAYLYHDHEL